MTLRSFVVLVLAFEAVAFAQKTPSDPANILGTWQGTSTCTDRIAAPACNDEVVIYDFRPGPKPGVIRWLADKVVAGTRQPMGELEVAWDREQSCWKAEVSSPSGKTVWKLFVDGTHLTGTGQRMPSGGVIRRIDAKKQ